MIRYSFRPDPLTKCPEVVEINEARLGPVSRPRLVRIDRKA